MAFKPTPTVVSVGPMDFPRYIIVADGSVPLEQRRYWTGEHWTNLQRRALLYADERAAWADAKWIGRERSQP